MLTAGIFGNRIFWASPVLGEAPRRYVRSCEQALAKFWHIAERMLVECPGMLIPLIPHPKCCIPMSRHSQLFPKQGRSLTQATGPFPFPSPALARPKAACLHTALDRHGHSAPPAPLAKKRGRPAPLAAFGTKNARQRWRDVTRFTSETAKSVQLPPTSHPNTHRQGLRACGVPACGMPSWEGGNEDCIAIYRNTFT